MGQIGNRFAQAFPRALVVSIDGLQPSGDELGRQWFAPDSTDLQLQVDGVMAEFTASERHWQQLSGIKADATALVRFSQGEHDGARSGESVGESGGQSGRLQRALYHAAAARQSAHYYPPDPRRR